MSDQELAVRFLDSIRNLMGFFRSTINNECTFSPLEMMVGVMLSEYENEEHENPITASELAKKVNVVPPSLTRVLNKMESMRIIRRKVPKDNRRVIYIELTSKGKEEFLKASNEAIEMTSYLFEKIGMNKAIELLSIVNDLKEAFQIIKEEGGY